ncbi:hypothetical protein OVA11_14145 [Caulobacter sp. SL161]|uniref:hypothetical protein n=1 Tax=Caulobacter sp. SL161 TaxID=2995156 RepID=UPI002273BC21|nr:hypothetical protein [Caulobacter sp. SL161]MCY1648161.1 hypothetical protein [Caulobacter sp. SL161]
MADDLFAHAELVEAQAAIDAARREREEAVEAVIKRRRAKTLAHEAALVRATHAELAAYVAARKRLGVQH